LSNITGQTFCFVVLVPPNRAGEAMSKMSISTYGSVNKEAGWNSQEVKAEKEKITIPPLHSEYITISPKKG